MAWLLTEENANWVQYRSIWLELVGLILVFLEIYFPVYNERIENFLDDSQSEAKEQRIHLEERMKRRDIPIKVGHALYFISYVFMAYVPVLYITALFSNWQNVWIWLSLPIVVIYTFAGFLAVYYSQF